VRSAFLITILLFACQQADNQGEATVSTDSTAVSSEGDTHHAEPDIEIQAIEIMDSIVYDKEKIRTFDRTSDDIYPWITTLDEGPFNETDSTFEFFRIVITTSEIYNGIYIERCSQGLEGGGRRIKWRRLIDDEELTEKFSLRGEFAGVTLRGWRGWNSFALNILGDKYVFVELENELVTVQKEK
jgi:hypothetical protein